MDIPVIKRTPKERLEDALTRLYELVERPTLGMRDRMELMTIGFLAASSFNELFDPEPEAEDTVAMIPDHKIPEYYSPQLVSVAQLLYRAAEDRDVPVGLRRDLATAAELVDSENHRLSTAVKQARQTAGGTQRKIRALGQTIRDLEGHLEELEREANG